MHTEIHQIRIPRRLVGVMPRAKQPEAYVVADAIPVEIRCYAPGEAPPTVRDGRGAVHRQVDGRPYMPFSEGGFAQSWERLHAEMEKGLRRELFPGRQGAVDRIIQARNAEEHIGRMHGWARRMAGNPPVTPKAGILHEAPPRLRDVIDDGRGGQAEAAAFLSGRIAMVGDELMVRTGLPRVRVRIQGIDVGSEETVRYLAWDEDPDWGGAPMAGDFRLDRREDAESYKHALLAALPAHGYGRNVRLTLARLDVVDGDALAACYDRAGSETLFGLVASANEAVQAMGHRLPSYPDGEVLRFVEARRLVAGRDEAGLAAWLDRIEETASHLPGEGAAGDPDPGLWEAETGFARARIRYREFVVPRMNLESGDEAALAAIGPA